MSAVSGMDGRLAAIASLVRPGARLADVGCDHGLLICALAADGQIVSGIACDVNPKPLAKAGAEIARQHLEKKLVCRLGDGLGSVSSDEVDDVVIAGMGGELIADILSRCPWKENMAKRFILQPMTRACHLRHWLCENGFAIETERACSAAGRVYTVMRTAYDGRRWALEPLDLYSYVGELQKNPSPEARELLRQSASALAKRAIGIGESAPKQAEAIYTLVQKLVTMAEGW
ncbi:MAG: class I SAM-dependent methyltransferase [Oscillospiraceae bacterium]